eukprot:11178180-Ditylum_brightwellii.AAC.1
MEIMVIMVDMVMEVTMMMIIGVIIIIHIVIMILAVMVVAMIVWDMMTAVAVEWIIEVKDVTWDVVVIKEEKEEGKVLVEEAIVAVYIVSVDCKVVVSALMLWINSEKL